MLEETVGVAIYALRRTPAHHTELLLLKPRGQATWFAVSGTIRPGEREAEAALRELLEQTTLNPARLYATPFAGSNRDAELGPVGRFGVFVAYVGYGDTVTLNPGDLEFSWCRIREAASMLALEDQRAAVDRLLAEFISRPPDESLRVV